MALLLFYPVFKILQYSAPKLWHYIIVFFYFPRQNNRSHLSWWSDSYGWTSRVGNILGRVPLCQILSNRGGWSTTPNYVNFHQISWNGPKLCQKVVAGPTTPDMLQRIWVHVDGNINCQPADYSQNMKHSDRTIDPSNTWITQRPQTLRTSTSHKNKKTRIPQVPPTTWWQDKP